MRRGAWLVALIAALAVALPAHAQNHRKLPANGKLGEVVGQQPYPTIGIDDKLVRLAPGGRIIDEQNRTIVHGALPRQAHGLYVLDMNGDISILYLLRPEELETIQRSR